DLKSKSQRWSPSQSAWLDKPQNFGWVTVEVARGCTELGNMHASHDLDLPWVKLPCSGSGIILLELV
ncbi:hypothetical protein, partial [Salmonella sp. s60368]|uniref:hypothetical protein n=1 Tax=Salmonella sp. s60368 TaxID=3159723 RepID=UPI00397FD195